ncbi:hypothetical protein Q1695_013720 [Nippostrongylus brasiliensis]|nr:hypothetical protein Q1695_013720 [Nippostrongylus brasiliensis]
MECIQEFDNGDEGAQVDDETFVNWFHVAVRSLQNMLGVIIFVRMSWITNEVGLAMTIGFILLALLVSFLTTMSVAAISTEQRHGFFASVSTYFSPAVAAGLSVLYVFSNRKLLCAILLLVAILRSRDHFKCRLVMMALVMVAVLLQMTGLLVP